MRRGRESSAVMAAATVNMASVDDDVDDGFVENAVSSPASSSSEKVDPVLEERNPTLLPGEAAVDRDLRSLEELVKECLQVAERGENLNVLGNKVSCLTGSQLCCCTCLMTPLVAHVAVLGVPACSDLLLQITLHPEHRGFTSEQISNLLLLGRNLDDEEEKEVVESHLPLLVPCDVVEGELVTRLLLRALQTDQRRQKKTKKTAKVVLKWVNCKFRVQVLVC